MGSGGRAPPAGITSWGRRSTGRCVVVVAPFTFNLQIQALRVPPSGPVSASRMETLAQGPGRGTFLARGTATNRRGCNSTTLVWVNFVCGVGAFSLARRPAGRFSKGGCLRSRLRDCRHPGPESGPWGVVDRFRGDQPCAGAMRTSNETYARAAGALDPETGMPCAVPPTWAGMAHSFGATGTRAVHSRICQWVRSVKFQEGRGCPGPGSRRARQSHVRGGGADAPDVLMLAAERGEACPATHIASGCRGPDWPRGDGNHRGCR